MYLPKSRKRPAATGLVLLCLSGAATTACSSDNDTANDTGDETGSAGRAGASQGSTATGTQSQGASSSTSSAHTTLANGQAGGSTASNQSGGAPGDGGRPGSTTPGATGGVPGAASGGSLGASAGSSALGALGGTASAGSTGTGTGGANGAGSSSGEAGAGGANGSGSTAGSSGTASANAGNAGTSVAVGSVPQIPSPALPTVETESFTPTSSTVDIADDCAIYANPSAPELSVVVADNKDAQGGGVAVFDMQGKLLQFQQEGLIGNIDLRAGFPFAGQSIILVGANNRTTKQLNFWQLDPARRTLSARIGETPRTVPGSYGFCMYHSKVSGKFYAFVTEMTRVGARVEQYELSESNGAVTATPVRSFDLSLTTEGCVADDELGWLYVAEEDVALWRYGAEPETGSARVEVAAVGDGHLVSDLEGISIAKGPGTSGYLVLSIQSEDRFVTFDRETNAYLRGFSVGGSGSIDTVNQTDGLDISTANLGPGFPHGALVVHDGENADGASSNLKYIPLQ